MSNMISDLDSNVVIYEDDERAYNVLKREHVKSWSQTIQSLRRNELWITDNKDFGD